MILGPQPAWIAAFREWFGVRPVQARLLLTLYEAGGEPLTEYDLSQRMGTTEHSIRTHVYYLRLALPDEALDLVRSRGYRLSEIGLEECRGAANSLLAALENGESGWPAARMTTR